LVAFCSSGQPGTSTGVVATMDASTSVIFFESTSIWSCLAAIQRNVTLIYIRVSLIAVKLASAVGEVTSIAWVRKTCGEIFGGIFVEETHENL
jgi:hypothetical protein